MKTVLMCAALGAALAAPAPAFAATRNFSVTDFDKVRVDGPYAVNLVTGRAPFARVEGSNAGLDALIVEVQGRTLVIRPNRNSWGGYPGQALGPVTVNIGTHAVSSVNLNGAGSLAIDRVSGLSFAAAAQGAGALAIANVQSDRLSLALTGAASARVGGKVLSLTASVRGTSLIDASTLVAKDATIAMEGPGEIRAAVSNAATISAYGPGRITLTGNPSCTTKGSASATVTGCR
jgi:hypothetical protein